ncbi:MAG: pilus assembly protein TadG-related protein [Pseudomonadota bacterium]
MLNAMIRRFRLDEHGGAITSTIIFATCIAMMLGLVVDVGRAYAERTRMQAWLDGVGVAVAAQLDGRPDAITRATWVAENAGLVADGAFSLPQGDVEDNGYDVSELRFLSALPETGIKGLSPAQIAAFETTVPQNARFALLDASPRAVSLSVLNMVSGPPGGGMLDLGVRTVAIPVRTEACTSPVVAVCAPIGGAGLLNQSGAQLRLSKNLDGVWEPGEYGIIADLQNDPGGHCAQFTGAERLTCLMAINAPMTSCPPRLDVQSGDGIDVAGALNTRFDIWADTVGHLRDSDAISSDRNTISGRLYSCNGAEFDMVSDSMGLPQDPCFHNDECDVVSPVVSTEDLDLYWEQTHGGRLPDGLETRYDVYVYETLEDLLDPEGPETSVNPSCNPNSAPRADRRLLDLALIDCSNLAGLQQQDVDVVGYVTGFMMEPATQTNGSILTFDGVHQNNPMQEGDIVGQWFDPTAVVGEESEDGTCASGSSDPACYGDVVLSLDNHGAGNNNGGFGDRSVSGIEVRAGSTFLVEATRDSNEWVRLDRFQFSRTGDLDSPDGGEQSANTQATFEAESMQRSAFEVVNGNNASGGKMARLPGSTGSKGTLTTTLDLKEGVYTITMRAQDESDGRSTVRLRVVHPQEEQEPALWAEEDLRVNDPRGRLTYDPYRDVGLMRIHVHQANRANKDEWKNVAMLFDTANITGGDSDLASTQFGNVLIVSEDGDANDPDDEAKGGWLVFNFGVETRIKSVLVFDTEMGGVIRLYDENVMDPRGEFYTQHNGNLAPMANSDSHDTREITHFTVPRLGDGKHVRMNIGVEGVKSFAYFLPDSGGLDEIEIYNEFTEPVQDDELSLELVRIQGGDTTIRSVVYD